MHSPYKQIVGARLARRGLAVAYGMGGVAYDDFASNAVKSASVLPHALEITFKEVGTQGGIIAVHGALGFEVLGADQVWHSTPILA